jgi:ketosteroid isomerase-like protein
VKIFSPLAGAFSAAFTVSVQLLTAVSAVAGSADSLAAAEKSFAREALEKGTRAAFLDVLAEDGIVFQPGPQNGRTAWEAKPAPNGLLQWEPVVAATSTTGDLGYTTGPWSFRPSPNEKPNAFGQFVSIWRWGKGKWKLIFDLDSTNPIPTGSPEKLMLVQNHAPHANPTEAFAVMQARDQQYIAARAARLPELAEHNVRLYQPNKFPITELAAAAAALRANPQKIAFGEPKGQVSQGGDLGYLWGEYRTAPGGDPTGYYLRIWRKDRAGEWKLAIDLIHPR